jgi:multicomponent Na+:H+ antiporter subunit E
MMVTAVLAVPMALLWMIVSNTFTPGGFLVGYVLGFALLFMMKTENIKIDWRKLPDQTLALGIYTVTLLRDIWLSSVDVLKRVLNPELPMSPGIIAVPTQDETESDFIAAFSAHGITITPGELVVDFDGSHTMYVHCLDIEASGQNADAAQTKRLKLLRRIEGKASS